MGTRKPRPADRPGQLRRNPPADDSVRGPGGFDGVFRPARTGSLPHYGRPISRRGAAVVDRYEGHISSIKGDGLLAVFGHPKAHENDVRRAVAAGLDITREVAQLSAQAERKFGIAINVRVGIHRGVVYLDTDQDDVYGFAANLAARLSGVAEPGTVAVSDAVAPLVSDVFELAHVRRPQ